MEDLLISKHPHISGCSQTPVQLSTHSSVQLPSWGRWSTNMKRAGFCQISDEFCSVYCSFLSPLCCCHPRIVNWYHSSSYTLLCLSSCARDDVMLPLVWINRRWPYADTEEWARPWLGVPALVSQNDWLLFLHPTRPNQTFTCAHTPMCNFFRGWLLLCSTASTPQQSMWNFAFLTFAANMTSFVFQLFCKQSEYWRKLLSATFMQRTIEGVPSQWWVQHGSYAYWDTKISETLFKFK